MNTSDSTISPKFTPHPPSLRRGEPRRVFFRGQWNKVCIWEVFGNGKATAFRTGRYAGVLNITGRGHLFRRIRTPVVQIQAWVRGVHARRRRGD